MQSITQALQQDKLDAFLGKMVGDLGAGITGALVIIGDRLGLYQAMVDLGPCTSQQLADATNTNERYIREWLANQAAAAYVIYDSTLEQFILPPEHAAALADNDSAFNLIGGFYNIGSVYHDEKKLSEAFKSGEGVGWGNHHSCLYCGTARFFRASYEGNLLQHWIPALDGVEAQLDKGILVGDVGCGFGESTILMAQKYPAAQFIGIDFHAPSIETANRKAAELNLTNITFEVGTAQDFPGAFDLITSFDCLHDMGDPVGAASHIYQALRPGGHWMVVEPFAGDSLQDNLNPVGRVFYGFSATVCVPAALENAPETEAMGAQAGPVKLRKVMQQGGFQNINIATQTPFNLVFDAIKDR